MTTPITIQILPLPVSSRSFGMLSQSEPTTWMPTVLSTPVLLPSWQMTDSHILSSAAPTATISALLFTQATTPNTQVYASIEKCFHQLFDKLEPAPAHHFAPTKDGTYIGFNVDSVGTIKSNLAYVQGPWLPSSNSSGHPRLGCKENRHDAIVSAQKIVSVVNWAGVDGPSAPSALSGTSIRWPAHLFLMTMNPGRHTSSRRVASSGGTRPPLGVTRENWEGANFFIHNYPPDGGAERNFDPNYQPKETEKLDTLAEDKSTLLLLSSSPLPAWPTNSAPGHNNANFMAQPEGQCGRMMSYVWNTALPSRDGDPEAAIIIHELTRCLSTRLTGGPLQLLLWNGRTMGRFPRNDSPISVSNPVDYEAAGNQFDYIRDINPCRIDDIGIFSDIRYMQNKELELSIMAAECYPLDFEATIPSDRKTKKL
ncbi:hypothetical protein BKA70DRAFT_1522195 [Coprinopsis sp. MPI-PUGE-AT-0042]|nr:hypothetical protein BKA70DRAFT_1522195 [Coprinopsis sp. MPI-PUGE-AT-0042]